MGSPLISFIVPVYNTEEYLTYCIESVKKQTYGEWELILIDDGSTDQSPKVCDLYASGDNRIRVIHKENSGQFDTRMRGISIAEGQYCTGIDSDDYIEPDCVEKLAQVVDRDDYDIVAWNIRDIINGREGEVHRKKRYGEYNGIDILRYVSTSTDYSFCNKLIKTRLLRDSRYGNIPSGMRHGEDHVLICPSLCLAQRSLIIDETLYNYRQIGSSVTHDYSTKRALDYYDSTECVLNIYSDYSIELHEIIEAEYRNLAVSSAYCLKKAFMENTADADEIRQIRSHPLYKKVSGYERFGNMTGDEVVFMKLFRLKADQILKRLYGT